MKGVGVMEIVPPLGTLTLALLHLGCGARTCKVSSAGDVSIIQMGGKYYFTQLPTKEVGTVEKEVGCGVVFYCSLDGVGVVIIGLHRP